MVHFLGWLRPRHHPISKYKKDLAFDAIDYRFRLSEREFAECHAQSTRPKKWSTRNASLNCGLQKNIVSSQNVFDVWHILQQSMLHFKSIAGRYLNFHPIILYFRLQWHQTPHDFVCVADQRFAGARHVGCWHVVRQRFQFTSPLLVPSGRRSMFWSSAWTIWQWSVYEIMEFNVSPPSLGSPSGQRHTPAAWRSMIFRIALCGQFAVFITSFRQHVKKM